jgi:Putative polyhydroxyalkanoic acid system protein (PHA_gran_rgn)
MLGNKAMPDLIVSVSHRLSQDEALRRIQAAVAQAKTQYSNKIDDLQESWNGDFGAFQISALNQQVSGTVAVNPSDVTVQITLPFLLSVFKSRIEFGLRDVLTKILA